MINQLQSLLQQLNASIERQTLIKITLGNRKIKSAELRNVFIKPVLLKKAIKLSFVYRYPTNDITKNFDVKESIGLIEKMMLNEFNNADIFTTENDLHFSIQKNSIAKIINRPATLANKDQLHLHDKEKIRIIKPSGNIYLKELGITTADGLVKKDMQDKYKQINRYIEIIDGIIKDLKFNDKIDVIDMGSGKGYLTFALYDYLVHKLNLTAHVTGIELRDELVNKCSQVALSAKYANLVFKSGTIQNAVVANIDLLIALHACDTATDEAIYSGIKAGARVIICAPCCHKQIRKQMAPGNELKSITKHGILLERQAEITTDAIRALLLEAHGYKTKVFEFIATEHTPKNVLIVATKTYAEIGKETKQTFLNKVVTLKSLFGIKTHYLETLLGIL
jgi:tRNA A58 N-methylase Trm61